MEAEARLPAPGISEAPEPAAARGERAAARRPPGERQAPGTAVAQRRLLRLF